MLSSLVNECCFNWVLHYLRLNAGGICINIDIIRHFDDRKNEAQKCRLVDWLIWDVYK
jgi:hypothetical protein